MGRQFPSRFLTGLGLIYFTVMVMQQEEGRGKSLSADSKNPENDNTCS